METLASTFGEEAPNARLAGRITANLTVLGAAHIGAAFTVDRARRHRGRRSGLDLDGADALRLSSAARRRGRSSSMATRASARSRSASRRRRCTSPATMASTSICLPCRSRPRSKRPADSANGIGLGDRTATVTQEWRAGLAIDLNPDHGRKFSATISGDPATGTETLSVSPKLDVRFAIDHVALGDEAPTMMSRASCSTAACAAAPAPTRSRSSRAPSRIETNPAPTASARAPASASSGKISTIRRRAGPIPRGRRAPAGSRC